MNTAEFIITGFAVLFAVAVIFMLTREFWCWYWKINERNELLRDIRTSLDKIRFKDDKGVRTIGVPDSNRISQAKKAFGDTWVCECGIRYDENTNTCTSCGKDRQISV